MKAFILLTLIAVLSIGYANAAPVSTEAYMSPQGQTVLRASDDDNGEMQLPCPFWPACPPTFS